MLSRFVDSLGPQGGDQVSFDRLKSDLLMDAIKVQDKGWVSYMFFDYTHLIPPIDGPRTAGLDPLHPRLEVESATIRILYVPIKGHNPRINHRFTEKGTIFQVLTT